MFNNRICHKTIQRSSSIDVVLVRIIKAPDLIFCSHIAINFTATVQHASCQWVSKIILNCEAGRSASLSVDIAALSFADKIFRGSSDAYSMKLLVQNFKILARPCSVKSWNEVSLNGNFDGCRFEN
jgi:hypothetical protein